MKTKEKELYSEAKEYYEKTKPTPPTPPNDRELRVFKQTPLPPSMEEIQDEHDGRWAGAAVIIAILAAAVLVTWGLNAIFSL
jgi:hypothetical protein